VPEPRSSLSSHYIIWILCTIGFFAIFSTTISKNPVLPLFISAMGGDESVIGIIAAVSPFAGILFSIPTGIFFDRYGIRPLLLLAGGVFCIAPLLYLVVFDPIWLIPVRFFHGIATAILGPGIASFIAREFSETKGEKLGGYSSATLVGRTIAPILGGVVLTAYAMAPDMLAYHIVYLFAFLSGTITLACILLMFWFFKETAIVPDSKSTSASSSPLHGIKRIILDIQFFSAMIAEFSIYASFGIFETFLPLYMLACGMSPVAIGAVLAMQVLVIACTKPFFGRRADINNQLTLIAAGLLLALFACLLAPAFPTFLGFVLINVFLGLGVSLATIATSTYVASLALKQDLGMSMGTLATTMDIGHAGGPLFGGFLIGMYGYSSSFYASAVLLFAGLICLLIARQARRGRSFRESSAFR
jgi:MFS family permease